MTSNMEVEQMDTTLDVPVGIRFYEAHFKLDAFQHIARRNDGKYHILVDSDVLCINGLPESLAVLVRNGIPSYYDVTAASFPFAGEAKTIADKERLMRKESFGLCTGGEFHGGRCEYFQMLYDASMRYWGLYKENYQSLSSNGDEMLTSCAVEELMRSGQTIVDVGTLGGIARYWSVPTAHIDKPLEANYRCFLIHLPADKSFLSSRPKYSPELFPAEYVEYIRKRHAGNDCPPPFHKRVVRKIKKLLGAGK